MPCPICDGPASPYLAKRAHGTDWQLSRCTVCGFGYVANRPTMAALNDLYAKSEEHLAWGPVTAEAHQLRSDAKDLAAKIARLTPPGRSLDVGCGDGAFSYHLAAHGFIPTLIDLDPRAREAAKVIPNSEYHSTTFEDFAGGPFAAIVMSQVLEHAIDPVDWLGRAARLLNPGGVLAVAVPNFGGAYRVLGARDPFIIPPLHLNYFTPKSLRLAMEKAGMSVVRLDSRNEISMGRSGGLRGAVKRGVVGAWNVVSKPLNLSARGIILRGFGIREASA